MHRNAAKVLLFPAGSRDYMRDHYPDKPLQLIDCSYYLRARAPFRVRWIQTSSAAFSLCASLGLRRKVEVV